MGNSKRKRERVNYKREAKNFHVKKMTSPKGDGVSEAFPAADDVNNELNPEKKKDFEVDPVSSEIKKQVDEDEEKESKKKDSFLTLKTTIIASAVIVAVAGAAFAITKKLREK